MSGITVKKDNIGKIAWGLFFLGILLMFVSLGLFFIYGPLFLASFVLSIVMMTRNKVASGIALLLCSVVFPFILFWGAFALSVADSTKKREQQEAVDLILMKKDLVFEDVEVYDDANWMNCKGRVRNNGQKTYEFVKVKVEWLDKDGQVLDTEYTYVSSTDGIRPSGAKSFRVMTEKDDRVKSANYSITK